MISPRPALATLALAACLLSGCGLEPDRLGAQPVEKAPGTMASEPPAPSEPVREATPTDLPAPEPAPVPEDFRTLTAEDTRLRFAVPKSWVVIDESFLSSDAAREGLEEAADAMGIDVDQMRTMMRLVDVLVMDSAGSNINVTDGGMLGEIPTASALRAQFKAFNADVSGVEDVETPVGTARVARYEIALAGRTQFGAGVFVRLTTGVANLTITAFSEDLRESLVDRVLPTLDEAGAPGEA